MGVRTANQIRREFLEFFEGKAHAIVPSAPVVPHDDPTLLFTNAGMNQFKDVFLGTGSRPYKRAADTQKCIRAGGKHNDLDDVGHDTYHHTFFEMLGNWSFGDYFKKEAITWAWELLTQVWGIDKQRLHTTYFQGDEHEGLAPDSEAADLWRSVTDIDPSHVHPGNKKDNFWEMGDTGPCGPCSEIHIDLTPDMSGSALVNKGDARVMEIWNLVFIQFNRGSDNKLTPLPAKHVDTGMGFERLTAVLQGKKSNYDTDIFTPIFAGIQRVTHAPPYTGLLDSGEGEGAKGRGGDPTVSPPCQGGARGGPNDANATSQLMVDIAYRVIADHIRCLTFALTDGAIPSNEGRGYVLRRILRRAVRYGRQYLNVHEPFLCKLVPVVGEAMADAFPELKTKPNRVAELIREEEESFIKTLDVGLALFNMHAKIAEKERNEASVAAARDSGELRLIDGIWVPCDPYPGNSKVRDFPPVIKGEHAFKLHDTYGFPIDLTEVMARERGMRVDTAEYERLMEEAREKARGDRNVSKDWPIDAFPPDRFSGHAGQTEDRAKYTSNTSKSKITALMIVSERENEMHKLTSTAGQRLKDGGRGGIMLESTCFYSESGGQVSDHGVIRTATGEFAVVDVKRVGPTIVHLGFARGDIEVGQEADLMLNVARTATMQNHTATHVLNWALREVLEIGGGGKVDQKGSLVDPDKTRFDFSHNKPLSAEEIKRIEELVTGQINANLLVYTKVVGQAEARKINTLRAVFGEKYPDEVRVVSVGAEIDAMLREPTNPEWMKYSVEFCGGTHVSRTNEIGPFVLTSEEAVAKGVRRVVGVSGEKAKAAIAAGKQLLETTAALRSASPEQIQGGLADLQKKMAESEIPVRDRIALREAIAELQTLVKKQSKQQAVESAGVLKVARQQLLERAERVNGSAIIVGELPEAPVEQIREAADWLRTQAVSAAVCLGAQSEGKPMLIAAMTDDLVAKGLKAGDLIKQIVPAIDGRGGGKPNLAQAGGNNPDGIPAALSAASEWIKQKLG